MKPNNPFLIAGYYGPAYFCDRDRETDVMLAAINNGRNVTLISPRRMGKTGLINHCYHILHQVDPKVVTIYIDIFHTQNLADFVRVFANSVIGVLDTAPQKAIERIAQFIRSCRPTLTFDENTGQPKISVDFVNDKAEHTLKEIFEYLGSYEGRCCIAFDEFQQIREYPESGVEALLRSYIQFAHNTHFIFSGSSQHLMEDIFLSPKRPFYQSTQIMGLESIPMDMYYEFAAFRFSQNGRLLPKETFEYIYNKYEGHTWYVQYVMNRLYDTSGELSLSAADFAIRRILEENAYVYERVLSGYTSGCVRLMRAIACEGKVKEILSGDFIRRYDLKAASSVSSMLKKLQDNELVYHCPEGYSIYDRFMSEWMKITFRAK